MKLSALAGAAALALAQVPLPPPAAAQVRMIEMNPDRSIEVMGEASVEATPDFAKVTLGVTTTGKDAAAALAANATATNALIAALKGEGIAAADIQTSSLSISPTFANPSPGSSAPPAITGYNVGDMVTVTARDLKRLGALLDKAVESGANAMYGVAFGESNPGGLLDKARPVAVADARRKAEIYAAAAGAKVGRLMELSEQAGQQQPAPFSRRVYATAAHADRGRAGQAHRDRDDALRADSVVAVRQPGVARCAAPFARCSTSSRRRPKRRSAPRRSSSCARSAASPGPRRSTRTPSPARSTRSPTRRAGSWTS